VDPPDFVARLSFKTTEQGGRRGPLRSGCHPQVKFEFSEMQTSTAQFFRDRDWIYPGEVVVAEMQMAGKEYFAGKLEVGMRFEVREGARVTAFGEILEICDQSLCRPSPGRPPEDTSGA
jgi:translation elongation factor EF-Tu-like GTPase